MGTLKIMTHAHILKSALNADLIDYRMYVCRKCNGYSEDHDLYSYPVINQFSILPVIG